MIKSDFVAAVADKSGLSKADAQKAVDAVNATLAGLASGDKITFPGFGTFENKYQAPRTGRNPATGEPISIGGKDALKFRASKKG
jgi:DNA-binding protein HU-beta